MPCTWRDLIPQPLCSKVCALPLCYNNHCPAQVSHELIFTFFPIRWPIYKLNRHQLHFVKRKIEKFSPWDFLCLKSFWSFCFKEKTGKNFPSPQIAGVEIFYWTSKSRDLLCGGFQFHFFVPIVERATFLLTKPETTLSASPREGSKDDKSVAKAPFKQPLVYGG